MLDECQLNSVHGVSFKTSDEVGSGGFGFVLKRQFDGEDIAVKTLAPKEITTSKVHNDQLRHFY